MFTEADCYQVGHSENPDQPGEVWHRDLIVHRDGRPYVLSVGTPTFIENMQQLNIGQPDEELQTDLNILPWESQVPEVGELCRKLHELPADRIAPFLIPQVEIELG